MDKLFPKQKNQNKKVKGRVMRLISSVTLLTFALEQVVLANPLLLEPASQPKEVSVQEVHVAESRDHELLDPTTAFLSESSTLSQVLENVQTSFEESAQKPERYSFDEAVELMREDFAAAVILESITKENLKTLTELDIETAVVVLEGELVLFSSGEREAIRTLRPTLDLLEQADFISHTHITETSQKGPSSFDLDAATASPNLEYVLTAGGVYAYNDEGLFASGARLNFETYLDALTEALAVSRQEHHTSVEARRALNDFLVQMDRYNESLDIDKDFFRASSQIFTDDFENGDFGDNWTVIRGNYGIRNGNELFGWNSYPVHDGGIVVNQDLESSNYELQMKTLYSGATTPRGFLMNYQDINNYYYFKVHRFGGATLLKKQDGVMSTVATGNVGSITNYAWHTLKVVVEDNNFKLYFNDALKMEATDENNPIIGGKVGIYADVYYVSFDDFSVVTIGEGSTPPVDTEPPVIEIVGNIETFVNTPAIVINYTVDGGDTKAAEINLVEGLNQGLTLPTESDEAGNATTYSLPDITLDTIAPEVILISATETSEAEYELVYELEGELQTEQVELVLGENVFERSFQDQAGNETLVTWTIIREEPAPVLTLDPPVLIKAVSKGFDDGNMAEVFINNNPVINQFSRGFTIVEIDENSGAVIDVRSFDTHAYFAESEAMTAYIQSIPTGRYVAAVVADEASYHLTTNAINALHSIGVGESFSIGWRDSYAAIGRKGLLSGEALEVHKPRYAGQATIEIGPEPVIVDMPTINALEQITNQTTITLSGTKAADTSVWVNGVEVVSNNAETTWTAEVILNVEGGNTLSVTAQDSQNNESAPVLASIMLDTIAPEIVVVSNVPSLTNQSELIIDYTVDGIEHQQIFNLNEGSNEDLWLGAVDSAGNVSEILLPNVVLDTTPPEIVVRSTVPSITNNELLSVEYTVDGVLHQIDFNLVEGSNEGLQLSAIDDAGNSATLTLPNIVLDTTPPEIVLVSEIPSLTNQADLAVDYTVDGEPKQYTFNLVEGLNSGLFLGSEPDQAGNVGTYILPDITYEIEQEEPPQEPVAGEPFTDDFNGGNLWDNWTQVAGNFAIKDGSFLYAFNSYPQHEGGIVLSEPPVSNDYEVAVKSVVNSNIGRGVLLRYQDLNNYYFVSIDSWRRLRIYKVKDGVSTTVYNQKVPSVDSSTWQELKVRMEGNAMDLYFAGEYHDTYLDENEPFMEGNVGIYTPRYYMPFDDFSMTPLNVEPEEPELPAEPEVVVLTDLTGVFTEPGLQIEYTVNGDLRNQTFTLNPGENILRLEGEIEGLPFRESVWVTYDDGSSQEEPAETAERFSLQTENDEIIEYLNGEVSSITTAEGLSLKNLILNQEGGISSANIKTFDSGSLQIIQDGQMVGLKRADGSRIIYSEGRIEKVINADGTFVHYDYVFNNLNEVLAITLTSADFKTVYDHEGRLKESVNRITNQTSIYEEGVLREILYANGIRINFASEAYGNGKVNVVIGEIIGSGGEALSIEDTDLNFGALTYYADGLLASVWLRNGDEVRYGSNGKLQGVYDANGEIKSTVVVQEGLLSEVTGLELVQSNTQAIYDGSGRLKQVKVDDLTIYYGDGDQGIEKIKKDDGTLFENITFGENGAIENAKITTATGEVRIYENSHLVRLEQNDNTILEFLWDEIDEVLRAETLTLPDEFTYNFDYTIPGEIRATLDDSILPDVDTVTEIKFDHALNLKQVIKQNNEIISYLDSGLVERIDSGAMGERTFEYAVDGSYVVRSEDREEYFNKNHVPQKTILSATDQNPNELEIVYGYGKIRKVYKNSAVDPMLIYSYRFNALGEEITVIEDAEENTVKEYEEGELKRSLDVETQILSTYAYEEDQVSEVRLTRYGRELQKYDYQYENNETLVTDSEGIKRVYGEAAVLNQDGDIAEIREGKLIRLVKQNETYNYTYHFNKFGEEIINEELTEKLLEDGSRAFYDLGEITRIERVDGAVVTDVVLSDEREIESATLTKVDGTQLKFKEGELLEEIRTDGTHLFFSENRIAKVVTDAKEIEYTYELDPNKQVTRVKVREGDSEYAYGPDDHLESLALLGVEDYMADFKTMSDTSPSSHNVAIGGDVSLSSNGRVGTASVYMDGEFEHLRISDSDDFNLSGGVWTIDFWVNRENHNRDAVVYGQSSYGDVPGNQKVYVGLLADGSVFMLYESPATAPLGPITLYSEIGSVSPNLWQHIALVQNGDEYRIYVDGVDRTRTDAGSQNTIGQRLNDYSGPIQVGGIDGVQSGWGSLSESYALNGWMDEFRISKGVARWTEDFSDNLPTEPYEADEYTSLLLHFDGVNRTHYKFNSMQNELGEVTGYSFSGSGGSMAYDAEGNLLSAGLASEINGANGHTKFYDASNNGLFVEGMGNVHLQTEEKVEGNAAASFDGIGDYLKIADSDSWNFGVSDFEIEAHILFDELPAVGQIAMIYEQREDANNYFQFGLKNTGSGFTYYLSLKTFGAIRFLWESEEFKTEITQGEWIHVKLEKTNIEEYRVYQNQNLVGLQKSSVAHPNLTTDILIGGSAAGAHYLKGKLDNFKISNGTDQARLDLHFNNEDLKAEEAFNQASNRLDQTLLNLLTLPYREAMQENYLAASYNTDNLTSWFKTTSDAVLEGGRVVAQEYSASGVMETQTKANKTVTLFDENRPSVVLDQEGETIMEYHYDEMGDIKRVYLRNARDALPDEVAKAYATLEEQRQKALLALSESKALAVQEIYSKVEPIRQKLRSHISTLESNLNNLENTHVKGKKARRQKSESLDKLRNHLAGAWGQWEDLHRKEADAYAKLDSDVQEASDKIEAETQAGRDDLATQEAELKDSILLHEISPVVYDRYRSILGRDPTTEEYTAWLERVSYASGDPLPESSISFDGVDDALSIIESDSINFAEDSWTVDFWLSPEDLENASVLWQTENGEIALTLNTDGSLSLGVGLTSLTTAPEILIKDTWSHVALVREGNNFKIYVNGLEALTLSTGFNSVNPVNSLTLGANFKGLMDEVRVSSSALWQSEFVATPGFSTPDEGTLLLIRQRMLDSDSFVDVSASGHLINSLGNPEVYTGDSIVDDPNRLITEVKTHEGEDLTRALELELLFSDEYNERMVYVDSVKDALRSQIENYLAAGDAARSVLLNNLGLTTEQIIPLSAGDADKILVWIESRDLHFGQSAFLALEALLDAKSISYDRAELATNVLLIDILTGVITPLDEGDLVLSLFSLDTAAKTYGLNLSNARLSLEDLKALYARDPNARMIAFVGTDHYVVIESITEDEIIYMDPSVGRDKENEIFTLSHEEFLGNWNGIAQAETELMSAEFGEMNERFMSESEAQRVRGSGFWSIFKSVLNIFAAVLSVTGFAPIALGLYAITATISAIQGDLAGVITSAIGFVTAGLAGGFASLSDTFSSLSNAFSGLGKLFTEGIGFIGEFFKPITDVIGGLTGNIGNFLGGLPGISSNVGVQIAKDAVELGLSVGFSKGLEAVGVSPELSGVLGSLASGALMGGAAEITVAQKAEKWTQAYLVNASISKSIAVQNIGQLGAELELDSNLTQLVSLSIGAIQGEFITNPATSLENAFQAIRPQISEGLFHYGLSDIGEDLGLNPYASDLIAAPLSAGLSGYLANNISLDRFRDITTQIGTQSFEGPLNFSFNVEGASDYIEINAAQLLNDSLGKPGLFENIMGVLKNAAISAANYLGPVAYAAAVDRIVFNDKQLAEGLSEVLNQNIEIIFDRPTIETILNRSGGVNEILSAGTVPVELPNGAMAQGFQFSDTTTLLFDSDNNFLGQFKNGNRFEMGEFSISENEFALQNGQITEAMDDGNTLKVDVVDGIVTDIQIEGINEELIMSIEGSDGPIFIEGPDNSQLKFDILNAIVTLGKNSIFGFVNGLLRTITQTNIEVSQTEITNTDNISSHTYVLNGINNPNDTGQVPEYVDHLIGALEQFGINSATGIALFEGTNQATGFVDFLQDSFFTLTFAKLSENMNKIISAISADISSGLIQIGDTINMVAHSGAGQAVLAVASKLFELFGLKLNVTLYGSPVFWPLLSTNIINLQVLNGDVDELMPHISSSTYPLYPAQFLLRGGQYVQETLAGMHHVNEPTYHSDIEYQNTGLTYIEYLANKIAQFLNGVIV